MDGSNSSESYKASSALGQLLYGFLYTTLCIGIGVAVMWLAFVYFSSRRQSTVSYAPLATSSAEQDTLQSSQRQREAV